MRVWERDGRWFTGFERSCRGKQAMTRRVMRDALRVVMSQKNSVMYRSTYESERELRTQNILLSHSRSKPLTAVGDPV